MHVLYSCSKKFCFKLKLVNPKPQEMINSNDDPKKFYAGGCHYENLNFDYGMQPNPQYKQVAAQGNNDIFENECAEL